MKNNIVIPASFVVRTSAAVIARTSFGFNPKGHISVPRSTMSGIVLTNGEARELRGLAPAN